VRVLFRGVDPEHLEVLRKLEPYLGRANARTATETRRLRPRPASGTVPSAPRSTGQPHFTSWLLWRPVSDRSTSYPSARLTPASAAP
jgi:hypothetical protein